MILNYYSIKAQVEAMADRQGLGIVYKQDLEGAYTDGSNLYVPTPDPTWTEERMVLWQYFIYHELGHNVPAMRDIFTLMGDKKIDTRTFFGACVNLLDDFRQEYYEHDKYLGRKHVMSKGRKIAFDKDYDKLGKDEDKYRQAMETLFTWDLTHRASWMKDLTGVGDRHRKHLTEQSLEWLETLEAGDYTKELYNLTTAYEEYDLVKRIINEVFKFNADEEEEKSKAQYEAEGAGKASKGEKGEDAEGKAEVDSDVKYSDLLMHEHSETGQYGSLSALRIEYDTSDGGYTPATKVKLLDFPNNNMESTDTHGWYGEDRYRRDIHAMTAGKGFATKIRQLLQVLSQSRYEYSQKRGKIHNSNMYRATMSGTGDYQRKVFKQKYQQHTLDTAVSVLVDLSGSMGGEKYVHAAHSAVLLNDAIAKINVPIEILGFTENNSDDVVHAIFKTFNMHINNEKLTEYFIKASQYMGNNADGESIQWAYERLMRQPQKRKVLVVLSDGSPASARYGIDKYTKDVVKTLESKIEVYGIGIMDNNVERIYKHNTVIHSADELERALLTVVKDKVLQR